ncbi:hypothetical protein F400_gp136 [Bacillus phage BCD7]|uniref:Uncharacterized protein n=1 Tax=Bacillus phage BCD7 TaxID=1136534 RepID=J9PU09_9CAUD|nr:hypothetical protein F400_gp136 [Bacillus phage BCD7]AEZ50583.1 hypothetical protein BCD7_0136 [Bacillus phage BCD7]
MDEFMQVMFFKMGSNIPKEEKWWFFLKKLDGSGSKTVVVNNYEFLYTVAEEFDARDKARIRAEVYSLEEGVHVMDFLKHLALHYYCSIHNAVEEFDKSKSRKYKRKGELALV